MLESHGNISILLSEVHEPSALNSAKLHRLSALKALFLFLDCNVTMLECNFNPFLTYGYIHFICLIQIQKRRKYRDIYRINQISQKIPRYEFLLISSSPTCNHKCGSHLAFTNAMYFRFYQSDNIFFRSSVHCRRAGPSWTCALFMQTPAKPLSLVWLD